LVFAEKPLLPFSPGLRISEWTGLDRVPAVSAPVDLRQTDGNSWAGDDDSGNGFYGREFLKPLLPFRSGNQAFAEPAFD
jgi:hypothetical protein